MLGDIRRGELPTPVWPQPLFEPAGRPTRRKAKAAAVGGQNGRRVAKPPHSASSGRASKQRGCHLQGAQTAHEVGPHRRETRAGGRAQKASGICAVDFER